MAYFINDKCTKSRNCLDVCPVDCIYEADKIYVIDPETCINCGACETECPVGAIEYKEGAIDTDENDKDWIEYNRLESKKVRGF